MNGYIKLINQEIIAIIVSFFIYLGMLLLTTIDRGIILFVITMFLSMMISSRIYYNKYKFISEKSVTVISLFTSLFITIIKDFFKVQDNYFALFLIALFILFYFLIFRKDLKGINKSHNINQA
jgi:hypothetical protein